MMAKMMMKWHIFATIILIQLKTFHCNTIEISSYSQVAKNGRTNEEPTKNMNQPPQIHRAREGVIISDLWFPKTFNQTTTENNNNSTIDHATGRAIDNTPRFPFPLKNAVLPTYDRPSNHRSNHDPRIIYASSPNQQIAQDRFVPHETADHFIEKNNRNRNRNPNQNHNHNRVKTQAIYTESNGETDGLPQIDAPSSDAKPATIDYQPPKNLYSFPPNSDSLYPPPGDTRKPISISSYLPPPSGPTNFPIYPGPVMPRPVSSLNTQVDNSGSTNSDMGSDENGDSNMNENSNMDNDIPDRPSDDMQFIDRPPPNFRPTTKPEFPALSLSNSAPHDHPDEHDHDHSHDHPPLDDDDEHHHHDDHFHEHDSFPPYDDSLKHLHGFPASPEVIIDDGHHDYFDHHHHHPHFDHPPPPPPPPPTTTPIPPPPPPPEQEEPEEQPRVKKYSYFYLSRSLWYIPLYFTVWFTFYVTYLILLSIGRHKVDLPNHITSQRSIRDLTKLDLTHTETVDKVNTLTSFVMSQIADFEKKYS